MACKADANESIREVERLIRADTPDNLISLRTKTLPGGYLSRFLVGKHRKECMGTAIKKGRREMSVDFAVAIRDRAYERLVEGDLEPNLSDGLKATAIIDARMARNADHDLMLKIAGILGGVYQPSVRVIDPEREALEAEFAPLVSGYLEAEDPPTRRPPR